MKRKNNIDGISIQNFVRDYLGTEHNCSKLKHQGLKSFDNPYVIGVSNDFALKNFDYVVRNELIIVIDDYGNPGTYINPIIIKKLIELETYKEQLKIISSISCHSFEEATYIYEIFNKLSIDKSCLEKLYGDCYELFYILNKNKLTRNIKKKAKDEAKRTLIFTSMKNTTSNKDNTVFYDDNDDSLNEKIENSIVFAHDMFEDYHVTEKVNRQKKLNYMKTIG